MRQTDMNVFMQSLRGNQPMIVLAFLLVRSVLTIEQLEAMTGLHNDTVRAAVKGLASKGLLFKQVGEHGRVTWLPVSDTFFGALFDQSPKTSDSGDVVVVVESEERNNLLSTSTTNKLQSPKTSDSGDDWTKAILAALAECGVHGKKARSLVTLEWVTPEYVRAQWAMVQDGFFENPAGMMIYRIEGNFPVEESKVEKEKVYKSIEVDHGKRGKEVISYLYDVDGEAAAFTGHKLGCKCLDCAVARMRGISSLCPDCKHYYCECGDEESEDEE